MAVTTTPRLILEAAYAKSKKNQPGKIATESVELLQVVIRAMRGLYAFAARFNPTYFADTEAVAYVNPGWARPQTLELIFRVEKQSDGTEVVVVPFDDRRAESGLPAIYRYGQVYRPASAGAPDPQAGTLVFFGSKRPDDPATLDATLDPLWVEQFNELLILEVAIYLAMKDARPDEVPALKLDRDKWAQLYAAHLEHETVNERRRFAHVQRFNSPSLVPVWSLLAGATATADAS